MSDKNCSKVCETIDPGIVKLMEEQSRRNLGAQVAEGPTPRPLEVWTLEGLLTDELMPLETWFRMILEGDCGARMFKDDYEIMKLGFKVFKGMKEGLTKGLEAVDDEIRRLGTNPGLPKAS